MLKLKINTLGRHILIEFYNCDNNKLKNSDYIKEIMNEAAIKSGATIVESCFHNFNPYGVSGVVIIAESHLTIHTWPEFNYAAVDIFTCGETINPWTAEVFINTALKAEKSDSIEISRGMKEKIGDYDTVNNIDSFKNNSLIAVPKKRCKR